MSLSIPNTFTGGTKARANEVNANFSAVAAKFTEGAGGISDVDIAAGAGIKASKLSSVAGQRVTNVQLEDNAVDSRILKDDPGFGSPNAAVALAAHIKDGLIPLGKLAITEYSHGVGFDLDAAITQINTGLSTGLTQPLVAYLVSPSRAAVIGFHTSGGTWWVDLLSDGGPAAQPANTLKVKYISLT